MKKFKKNGDMIVLRQWQYEYSVTVLTDVKAIQNVDSISSSLERAPNGRRGLDRSEQNFGLVSGWCNIQIG